MTRSLLQLTYWKIININPFCCLQNECVFCTCKQDSDCIPDLKVVRFPSYLLFDFFMFLSFWMVLPPMSCSRLLFLKKAIIVSTENVFSKALLSVWLYVIISCKNWTFCVVFGFCKPFPSRSLIFLISVSIKNES